MDYTAQSHFNRQLHNTLQPIVGYDAIEEARQIRWRLQDILADNPNITKLSLILQFIAHTPQSMQQRFVEVNVILWADEGAITSSLVRSFDNRLPESCGLQVKDDGQNPQWFVTDNPAQPFKYSPRALTYYGGAYTVEYLPGSARLNSP
jgi:hypothetical protein